MDFVCADVFDLLTDMESNRKHGYDYIILDPPAFTKSRDTIGSAIKGYKAINAKSNETPSARRLSCNLLMFAFHDR